MDKEKLVHEAEKFMRDNIPKTRPKEAYLRHVLGARDYALKLADIYSADRFIVEMASLLHDVGADAGWEHAPESARISGRFLSQFDIPAEIRDSIISCIGGHSHIADTGHGSIEEQMVRDADGIIFIEDTYKAFFEAMKKELPLEEARRASIKKTEGMMDKIRTEEGIRLAKKHFKAAIEYLKSAS